MKLLKKAISLTLVVFMSVYIFAVSASAVNLRFLQDPTFVSHNGNLSTTAITNIVYPFRNRWNIQFSTSVFNVTNTMLSRCTSTLSNVCSCNSACTNETTTAFHHTNAYKNLSHIKSTVSTTGYALTAVLASSRLCGTTSSNTHSTGIGGIGYVGGVWTYNNYSTMYSDIVKVRVIHHELSHNYGCIEGVCTPNAKCIMNGGYDTTSLITMNIWCTNCANYFDPALH